jgi:histidinol-phosphate/aromatic aminotransferase/cobyric acid decarboxylase-like protein
MVNEAHLVETCGQDGCHTGVDEAYVDYAAFIHGRSEVVANNPLHSLIRTITDAFGRLFGRGDEA